MLQANAPLVQQTIRQVGQARANDTVSAALSLYRKARRRGVLSQLWSRLTGERRHLLSLDAGNLVDRRHVGTRTVRIDQIRGSIGRVNDFDAAYNPIKSHNKGRWVSVAAAWLRGVVLPPVSLIQVGSDYYVQDGNHRVSVAKALGRVMIDAEICVWQEPKTR